MDAPERNKERIGRGVWECFHSFPYTLQALPPEDLESGIDAYRALAESVFRLYPCMICRRHLQANRLEHLRRLDQAVRAGRATGPSGIVRELCLWAFELHNGVTLRKRASRARGVISNRFIALEEAGDDDATLAALSERYNIVY